MSIKSHPYWVTSFINISWFSFCRLLDLFLISNGSGCIFTCWVVERLLVAASSIAIRRTAEWITLKVRTVTTASTTAIAKMRVNSILCTIENSLLKWKTSCTCSKLIVYALLWILISTKPTIVAKPTLISWKTSIRSTYNPSGPSRSNKNSIRWIISLVASKIYMNLIWIFIFRRKCQTHFRLAGKEIAVLQIHLD